MPMWAPGGVLLAATVAVCGVNADPALRDFPIAGLDTHYLDSGVDRVEWSVAPAAAALGESVAAPFKATVPGDIITDLERAGEISDIWFETTWRNATPWDKDWTYTLPFDDTAATAPGTRLLVFDGVKMGAEIKLNGVTLGVTADQFLRYVFPVSGVLKPTGNTLEVAFSRGIDVHGRIWKSVYLVTIPEDGAAITHVVPHTFYRGRHPTSPLAEHRHAGFTVNVSVHLLAATAATAGSVEVVPGWGGRERVTHPLESSSVVWLPVGGPGEAAGLVQTAVTVTLDAPAADIELWWPNGMGTQPLYDINVSVTSGSVATASITANAGGSTTIRASPSSVHATARRVGFREFAYVTANDTDPKVVAEATRLGVEGTGNHTAAWRVNGALVFARGANVVPMEEVEGRRSVAALTSMLVSAAEARMNTLRIWAGGIFFSTRFYQLCDELGLMVYHDLMFIEQGHAPCCPYYACTSGWSCAGNPDNTTCDCTGSVADLQRREIQHQLRRLGQHPSIVVWDACNECGGFGIYGTFVMRTVAEEDKSRAIWPSCPSNGWVYGVQRLNSRPLPSPPDANGLPTAAPLLASGGQPPHNNSVPCTACQCGRGDCSTAEHHGPYIGGSGWWTNANTPDEATGRGGRGPPVWMPLKDTAAQYTLPAGRNANLTACPGSWTRTIDSVQQCRFARGGVGATVKGSFTSEFGAVAMPSFESLSATLLPEHLSLHSPPMAYRNWPADGAVASFWGTAAHEGLNRTGEAELRIACYQSQLAQALEIQSNVGIIRSSNSFGALTWQLNDIYPSGSWGSLEYGTVDSPGQVVGGRWRILHHLLRREVWVDTVASCGADGYCYVRSDGLAAEPNLTVTIRVLSFATGAIQPLANVQGVALGVGAGQLRRFCVGAGDPRTQCTSLRDTMAVAGFSHCWTPTGQVGCALTVAVESTPTLILLDRPEVLALPVAHVTATISPISAEANAKAFGRGRVAIAEVTLHTNATALFVTLSTLASGRFSDNAVHLIPGVPRVLQFIHFGSANTTREALLTLSASLSVMHVEKAQISPRTEAPSTRDISWEES